MTVTAPVRHNLSGSPGRSDDVCTRRQVERESKPKLPCPLMAVLLCFYGSCKLRQAQIPKTPLLCRRDGGRFQRGTAHNNCGSTEDVIANISTDLRFWKGKQIWGLAHRNSVQQLPRILWGKCQELPRRRKRKRDTKENKVRKKTRSSLVHGQELMRGKIRAAYLPSKFQVKGCLSTSRS